MNGNDIVKLRYLGSVAHTLVDGTDEYTFSPGQILNVPFRVASYAQHRLPGLFSITTGSEEVQPVLRKARTVGEVFASDPDLGSVEAPKVTPPPTVPVSAPAAPQPAEKRSWKNKK